VRRIEFCPGRQGTKAAARRAFETEHGLRPGRVALPPEVARTAFADQFKLFTMKTHEREARFIAEPSVSTRYSVSRERVRQIEFPAFDTASQRRVERRH
jgi:hypothetical protein